jgi:hypothetical protein
MSEGFPMWHHASVVVLPLVPEALALVAGLVVMIVLRRRLGQAAPMALGGVALLALATAGDVAWKLWVLSREWAPITLTDDGRDIRQPAGLQLARDLGEPMGVALLMVYLVGLALVASAVFAGRRTETTVSGSL